MGKLGLVDHTLKGSAQNPSRDRVYLSGRWCLVFALGISFFLAVVRLRADWISDAGVNGPASIFLTLAVDLAHGIFYRPLFGPAGYGGTVHFPLYFVLHALLLKLGMPLLLSAYLLSAVDMLSLIAAFFVLLRRSGVERWLAGICAVALLSSESGRFAVVNPHADALASSLSLWGLVVIVGSKGRTLAILLASALFTLAWSAKLTTCFGVAAAVVWLFMNRERGKALQLTLTTMFGYLFVATAVFYASNGRALRVFGASSTGGMMSWTRILYGPAFMAWDALLQDPGIFVLILFALTVLTTDLLETPKTHLRDLATPLLILTFAATAVIFSYGGVGKNHLLDVQIAALFLLAQLASRSNLPQRRLGIFALALSTMVATGFSMATFLRTQSRSSIFANNGSRFKDVLTLLRDEDGPVLSENETITLLMGQTPYVMDAWMLRSLRERIPDFGDPLLDRLRKREFGAVVLSVNPDTSDGQWWYSTQDFGPGFISTLKENYRMSSVIEDAFIYVPLK